MSEELDADKMPVAFSVHDATIEPITHIGFRYSAHVGTPLLLVTPKREP